MSALAAITPTMSSLEIAELTGKPHRNVMGDIRRILNEAGIGQQGILLTYRDAQGKNRPCFRLPRKECDLVISGYSVKYRWAIIQRWHELEAEKSRPMSRKEELRRELAALEAGESAATVIDAIRPIHDYGSRADNGRPRIGLRRAAWVAARRSRLEEAAAINRELRELDQMEMDLMIGGAT